MGIPLGDLYVAFIHLADTFIQGKWQLSTVNYFRASLL